MTNATALDPDLARAKPTAARRYESLDSLRGLAAVSVVVGHLFLIYLADGATSSASASPLALLKLTPLRIFWDGGSAVILFFVLSGVVLSLPYLAGRPPAYGPYLAKRTCRIYIPYIVAVAVAVVLKSLLYHGPIVGVPDDLNKEWALPTTPRALGDHLLLVTSVDQRFDPVTWSLTHEMRASILFPLIMALVLRAPAWAVIGVSMGGVLVGLRGDSFAKGHVHRDIDVFQTVMYLPMFVIGALTAKHRGRLVARFAALPLAGRLALTLVAMSLLAYRGLIPFNVAKLPIRLYTQGLGACLLIVAALGWARFSDLLCSPVLVFFGRISYSLYLYHLLVYLGIAHAARGSLPPWVVSCVAFALAFPLAVLAYELVEKPSIELGRRIARRMGQRRPARPRSEELAGVALE